MFTECPACQTLFRVTAAILRQGHGHVECGQCHTVFDAIERLVDDEPAGLDAGAGAQAVDAGLDGANAPDAPPSEPWAHDLPTGEFVLRDGELIPVAPPTPPPPVAATPAGPIVVEEPVSPEEITLEGDRIEISGVYRAPEDWAAGVAADDEGPVLPPVTDEPSVASVEAEPDAAGFSFDPPADERAGRRAVVWGLLSLVLLVALAAQAVHHFRQDLVRHPRLGPAMLDLYATLGLPLTPNWDVTGYEVQQWGVAADPAASGTLRLRASIMNRAGFAQPYPLLKLTLEDRWGTGIGAREFEPREYLGPGIPTDRLLAPGQRVSADIGIVDPGAEAVGFHVDVCLAMPAGHECASQVMQARR